MFSIYKKMLIVLIATAFISSSFAGGFYHRSARGCVNGHCGHASVNKHCYNGHCGGSVHTRGWTR